MDQVLHLLLFSLDGGGEPTPSLQEGQAIASIFTRLILRPMTPDIVVQRHFALTFPYSYPSLSLTFSPAGNLQGSPAETPRAHGTIAGLLQAAEHPCQPRWQHLRRNIPSNPGFVASTLQTC